MKKWTIVTCGVCVLGFVIFLIAANPGRNDWIEWNIQQITDQMKNGATANTSNAYQSALAAASSQPYTNDILFSLGTQEFTTGQRGYVGIFGHWFKAEKYTTELTSHGRVFIKNPYIGFWGWLYKTFH